MKFTIVFTTLLCISTSWAVLAKKVEDKDKREAPVGYGSQGLSAHSYQSPASLGQGDASAISVGAGYSIGGAKPSYSFGGQGSSGALQYSAEGLSQLAPNSHGSIQLAPITLQPSHGGAFATADLSQFMNQISHSLNAGGISLQPSTTVAEFHQGQGAEGAHAQATQGGQEYSFPQFSYAPKQQQQFVLSEQLQQQLSSAPAYSSGTKGLGSYSTGPVLFTPSESQSNAPAQSYGSPSAGQSFDVGSLSLGGGGHSLAGLGLGSGLTLGGAGHSFGGAGQSFGGAGHSFGGAGHSLGGAYKQLSSYAGPGKTSFKPSAYLGSSVQGDSGHGQSSQGGSSHGLSGQGLSGHGLSGLSGSYSAPSFGSYRGASHGLSLNTGAHGASFGGSQGFGSGSSKFIAPAYQSAKGEGLDGASAFSSGHVAPPGTTYGFPSGSYSNNAHAASSNKPYYVTKHHHASPSSFGEGSSSYKSPASSHSSLSSYSSGPKYSFGGSSSHYSPKDTYGAASETSYNTIKYSEELKPRAH
ncbi:hypothetical protein PYW07_012185 [Mythimna separata]|uniref:Uncharacterized protein n=1 Tax=Mythimna separata TaxID=271217 RepID=A0AAD7YKQ3_MYTSE|nr:hypothetical protein PYW07_012185 [Mythimna separata]